MASRAVAGLAGHRSRSRSQTASVLATSPFGCGGRAPLPVRSLTKRANRSSTSGCEPSVARSGPDDHSFIGAATATTNDRGEYRLGGLLPGEYIVLVPARQVVVAHALAREVQAGRLQPTSRPGGRAVTGGQGDSGRGFVDRPRWVAAASATKRRAAVLSADVSSLRADDRPDRAADDHRRRGARRDRPAAATGADAARVGIRRGSRRRCRGHSGPALAEGAR